MPQGTSLPVSCHIRLSSGKPQSNVTISGLVSVAAPDSSLIQIKKPVEHVRLYTQI